MQLAIGLMLMAAGVICLILALPQGGKPRWFVGTNMEVPVVLAILVAFVVGMTIADGGGVALW